MPRGELRISGLLQAAAVGLALGWRFRHTPATAAPATWPYFLAGYGFLAATVPWLIGGVGRNEFSPRLSALLGVVFAVPVGISGYWLSASPYRAISLGCWVLVAAWALHFAASMVVSLRK